MKSYVFVTEDDQAATSLVREAEARGINPELMIGDTTESVTLRGNYDITTRPAALVTQDDGSYVQLWQGTLPTIAELDYAMHGRL